MFEITEEKYMDILRRIDSFIGENGLDEYYKNSVLQFDFPEYPNSKIEDFFFHMNNGNFYNAEKRLEEQYSDEECSYEHFTKFGIIETILTIISKSSLNEYEKKTFLLELFRDLGIIGLIMKTESSGYIKILNNKHFDSGSYSNIFYYSKGVLLKKIKPEYLKTDHKQRIKHEFENMEKLQASGNILRVYSLLEDELGYTMEHAKICLHNYLKTNKLTLKEKINIIEDILNGIKDAHDNSIIHRDLHLGNVLKVGNKFVISDFGLGKDLSKDKSFKSSNTGKSNTKYVDPEFRGDQFTKLDKISDIYSIGEIIEAILEIEDIKRFSYFLSICKNRERDKRYENIEIVKDEFTKIAKTINKEILKEEVEKKIKQNIVDQSVADYLSAQIKSNQILDVALKHGVKFADILSQCEELLILKILFSIQENDCNDYKIQEIIGNILYKLFFNISDYTLKSKIKDILLGYFYKGSYHCENLYNEIK